MPIQKKELRVLNKKGDCQRDSVLKSADKKGKKEYRATIKTKILKREPVLECSALACLLVCHPVCASASSRALIMRPRLARTCALANMQRHTLVHTHWKLTSRISLTQCLIVPLTNSGTRHWPAALSHSSKCLVMQLLKCHPVWTEEHSRTLRLTFTLSFWIFSTNLRACLPPTAYYPETLERRAERASLCVKPGFGEAGGARQEVGAESEEGSFSSLPEKHSCPSCLGAMPV